MESLGGNPLIKINELEHLDPTIRENGRGWASSAHAMVGCKKMEQPPSSPLGWNCIEHAKPGREDLPESAAIMFRNSGGESFSVRASDCLM